MTEVLELEELLDRQLDRPVLWAGGSVRDRASEAIPALLVPAGELPEDAGTLVVCGGGTLIDRAKVAAAARTPRLPVIAVPSIWGSGAEASPIAVLDDAGEKTVHMGDELLPAARVRWPALLDSVPGPLARWACGDAWAHALEGFLSPLGNETTRRHGAAILRALLELPLEADPGWLDASADACALQASTSVGLVHGIAHVVEAPLRAAQPDAGWSHARICSTLLAPVLHFLREENAEVWPGRADVHDVPAEAVEARAAALHDSADMAAMIPVIGERWAAILRDPSTRTSPVLVRRSALDRLVEPR